jgi:hypothetical protein
MARSSINTYLNVSDHYLPLSSISIARVGRRCSSRNIEFRHHYPPSRCREAISSASPIHRAPSGLPRPNGECAIHRDFLSIHEAHLGDSCSFSHGCPQCDLRTSGSWSPWNWHASGNTADIVKHLENREALLSQMFMGAMRVQIAF